MFKIGDLVYTDAINGNKNFGYVTEVKYLNALRKIYYVVHLFYDNQYHSFYREDLSKVNRPLTIKNW